MGAVAVQTGGAGRVLYAALTVRWTAAIKITSRLRGFRPCTWFRASMSWDVAKLPSGRGFWVRIALVASARPGWNFPSITLVRYERVFGGPAATFLVESCGRTRGLVGDLLGPL
jgi:hypothetical protein